MNKTFRYPCVQVRQKAGAKELLMFSASAIDINSWIGVPQRLSLAGNETAGFQRTVSTTREAALRKFFSDDRNVIQNPLLCAIRLSAGIQVKFCPACDGAETGHVEISAEEYSSYSFAQLLKAARQYLEQRAPALTSRELPADLIQALERQINENSLITIPEDVQSQDDIDQPESEDDEETSEPAEDALFDESQITDFWDQLRAREEIALKFTANDPMDSLLGFSRDMLESYLRPVILVDGQHRLRGAILAARDVAEGCSKAEELATKGGPPALPGRQ